jgi:hypothetical protein
MIKRGAVAAAPAAVAPSRLLNRFIAEVVVIKSDFNIHPKFVEGEDSQASTSVFMEAELYNTDVAPASFEAALTVALKCPPVVVQGLRLALGFMLVPE